MTGVAEPSDLAHVHRCRGGWGPFVAAIGESIPPLENRSRPTVTVYCHGFATRRVATVLPRFSITRSCEARRGLLVCHGVALVSAVPSLRRTLLAFTGAQQSGASLPRVDMRTERALIEHRVGFLDCGAGHGPNVLSRAHALDPTDRDECGARLRPHRRPAFMHRRRFGAKFGGHIDRPGHRRPR